jgi:hypothetical protein
VIHLIEEKFVRIEEIKGTVSHIKTAEYVKVAGKNRFSAYLKYSIGIRK